ncbi:hypothetical protein A2524_04230 [Candidatus Wolfebacteria bacterium RIFOXYD12_FULL_48_21]|uniref:GIY-YIG domain-containing protein n=1 Tax=Candidatus Wolfebacteria bacterium RIFOXYD1_FULL_48_65 TaxID=1802561 RepID=A0A1F8E174_9BACT|nr:MAG: hypothetical protein A2610_01860 [Candidatus Wolfebacteria bacterium RIFOXYD1_FULL_48_65]OGM95392.1 MAG: hypothetical protein A2524_04230 [Candidatus Wolfebacteria bacterium RIFOXYD12_FULL_48_21]OGM97693.1 MAG: hypothetical protein A2532_04395 [Candidatus Wolfebacteria bacterium RIFOXYD2_FULL_48_11]
MKHYYIYILTNNSGTLYIGVTNDLKRRVWEHKHKVEEGFTGKYNIGRLVYFEQTNDVCVAIEREKQLKNWRREKKIKLIGIVNPSWSDLYEEI